MKQKFYNFKLTPIPQPYTNHGEIRPGSSIFINLTKDEKDSISNVEWTVYGKIKRMTKTNGMIINYTYGPDGNRISKITSMGGLDRATYYVRDAGGNVMSIYTRVSSGGATITALGQSEIHLYGSNRLGIYTVNVDVQNCAAPAPEITYFRRGDKGFELTNHLGNVLVTISDKKIGVDNNSDGIIDYYNADVISAQDYYPFGQLQPGRQYGTLGRFGFNGKEQDAEVKGSGAQYDYGFRIYDPRLGKFLSTDPLYKEYPELTPYQFASNKPINSIDLDGLESKEVFFWTDVAGRTTMLEVPVNNPYNLGKGVLYHQYKTSEVAWRQLSKNNVEVTLKTTDIHFYIPPQKSTWERVVDWFSSVGPQIQVWGSGTERYGNKADPNKPVHTVNLNDEEWEAFFMLGELSGTPDLKGFDSEKVTELTSKISEIVKSKIDEQTTNNEVSTKNQARPSINTHGNSVGQPDPNTIMYPSAPGKNGKINEWSSDSSSTKPRWRKYNKSHPHIKEPKPKRLGN